MTKNEKYSKKQYEEAKKNKEKFYEPVFINLGYIKDIKLPEKECQEMAYHEWK